MANLTDSTQLNDITSAASQFAVMRRPIAVVAACIWLGYAVTAAFVLSVDTFDLFP